MKYKVLKKSDTGKEITNLIIKAKKAELKTYAFSTSVGGSGFVYNENQTITSGITGIILKNEIPSHFRHIKQNIYMPDKRTKGGSEIQEKLDTLPIITRFDLDKIVTSELKGKTHIGFTDKNDKYFLIDTGDYPIKNKKADVIEITQTEYEKLFSNA